MRELTTRKKAETADTLTIPLAHLLALADPLRDDPWTGTGPYTPDQIHAELAHPTRCPHPHVDSTCRACHVRRIAHFVTHPPKSSDPHPIEIDVGLGTWTPNWPLLDGNHRVAAHTLRGDPRITVAYAGDVDRALAVLVDGANPDDT